MRREFSGKSYRYRNARCFATFLVNGYPPQIQRSIAVASKVKGLPVWGPDRIPIERGIIRDANDRLIGMRVVWGDGPNITLPIVAGSPERDSITVRRPARLCGIAFGQQSDAAGRHVYNP